MWRNRTEEGRLDFRTRRWRKWENSKHRNKIASDSRKVIRCELQLRPLSPSRLYAMVAHCFSNPRAIYNPGPCSRARVHNLNADWAFHYAAWLMTAHRPAILFWVDARSKTHYLSVLSLSDLDGRHQPLFRRPRFSGPLARTPAFRTQTLLFGAARRRC